MPGHRDARAAALRAEAPPSSAGVAAPGASGDRDAAPPAQEGAEERREANARPGVPETFGKAIERAIEVVLAHGDSFVLPPGFEIEVIRDRRDDVAALVRGMYLAHPRLPEDVPLLVDVLHAAVGDAKVRPITRLDPAWNVYLLALVIAIAPDLESARLPTACGIVHSFRFAPGDDPARLFDTRVGWHTFCDAGRARAARCSHVLSVDIRDFSRSICHRRLESALRGACPDAGIVDRIMRLLEALSGGAPTGLPVGAPAFALLAELALDPLDRALLANSIEFVRYIDDLRIFARSRAEAEEMLSFVSEQSSIHGGFSLQHAKTAILSSEEFLARLPMPAGDSGATPRREGERAFATLRVHVDRYADRTDVDDDAIRRFFRSFDLAGLLAAQLRKSRVSESMAKRIVRSIAHLDPAPRTELMAMLGRHLVRFAPVFPGVVGAYLEHAEALDATVHSAFAEGVKALWRDRAQVLRASVNQIWAIRVLARNLDEDAERILADICRSTDSASVRRDAIIALSRGAGVRRFMAPRGRFSVLNPWDRHAVIAVSRTHPGRAPDERTLTAFERILLAWAQEEGSQAGDAPHAAS